MEFPLKFDPVKVSGQTFVIVTFGSSIAKVEKKLRRAAFEAQYADLMGRETVPESELMTRI